MNAEANRGRAARFRVVDQKPPLPDVRKEVRLGLSADPKRLSPKYFYDEAGSKLFEAITELPEYYLTRTEIGILRDRIDEIAAALGEDVVLVEYGSGSSLKIRILLEAGDVAAYVPVDISKDHLVESARGILADFPDLAIYPTCADYTRSFELPAEVAGLRRVAFFPGSSIGNFEPRDAREFLEGVAEVVGSGGMALVGVDRKKDPAVLDAAYNDAQGVTRAFNLNLLTHLNDAVGTDFDPAEFEHAAHYDDARGRIEMHLVSRSRQTVHLDDEAFVIEPGERIHTENSYKYDPHEFIDLAGQAGFELRSLWGDPRDYFMVLLLQAT